MHFGIRARILLLLAPVVLWASPEVNPHVDFNALRQLDAVSSGKIESLDDATAYVRKSATLCGVTDSALLPDDFENRLAASELAAAKDPNSLVSDDRVAETFNFISDEFRVEHPARLTASDILEYRSVMASIFPHVFSPKSVGGSRPVGAILMLYQLWYNGGVTEGVKRAAQLDRPPGSLKISGGTVGGRWTADRNPNLPGREYQAAGRTYFRQHSLQDIRGFADRLIALMALTGGR